MVAQPDLAKLAFDIGVAGMRSAASRPSISALRNLVDLIESRGLVDCVLGISLSLYGGPAQIQLASIADIERGFSGDGFTMRVYRTDDRTHAELLCGNTNVVACESLLCGREPGEYVI